MILIFDDKISCWIEYKPNEAGCYPPKAGNYLTCNMNSPHPIVEEMNFNIEKKFWQTQLATYIRITHWRYLPNLPKV